MAPDHNEIWVEYVEPTPSMIIQQKKSPNEINHQGFLKKHLLKDH